MGPKTLDELLEVVPGLRRARNLNAHMLRLLLDRRKGECIWCGGPVPKGRRRWCGQPCVDAFNLRCTTHYTRTYVVNRDKGVCRQCGRDTKKAERIWRHYSRSLGFRIPKDGVRELLGYGRGTWREVDHIQPVAKGGGLCGPEGLQLLCGRCHAEKTGKKKR